MRVIWRAGEAHTARELGAADGFSRGYRWEPANGHAVEMDDGDVDKLRQVHPLDAAEFDFEPAGKGK